jgi:tRNA U34 5-methylaminomethyl-2-thiouridine-forming methyltransferase MnmC
LLNGDDWREGQSHWQLHLGDAAELWRGAWEPADLIFFDPFSPASNPALWTPAAFALLRAHARSDGAGCTLFTYSAATPTRVSLLLGGFYVGTGIATGTKKETTVAATDRALLDRPLDARWLSRWERSAAQAPHGLGLSDEIKTAVRSHRQF